MTLRIDTTEYQSRPFRVHDFLQGVPLEDVWAIRLRGGGPGRTIHDLRPLFSFAELQATNLAVKGLFRLRFKLGTLFGWDQQRLTWSAESYVHRLTPEDRSRSAVPPGTLEGVFEPFTTLYVFEHEQLSELRNATVHGFVSLAMEPTEDGYLAFLAVYVKPVSRFTGLYMKAIAPFRRLLVYPAMLRKVQRAWAERYGAC